MRRRANKDPDLFAGMGHNQPPRPHDRESDRLYGAVLFLRIYAGRNVWRVGCRHQVGHRQLTTHQLVNEARSISGVDEFPDYVRKRLGVK